MVPRIRTDSSESDASDHFLSINERPVYNISFEFLYRPRTLTLLVTLIIGLVCFAFLRDDSNLGCNIKHGTFAAISGFLMISTLYSPNGPFIRPHPALWRMVFGLSLVCLMALTFTLFQNYDTVRSALMFLYPDLKTYQHNKNDTKWGQDCTFTYERLRQSFDFYVFAHYIGWILKALLIRHYGILWTISIMWECTEILFLHLLPNFQECWWDSIFLDIVLANGAGIWNGMLLFQWVEMRAYKWESVKDIHSHSGKLKRMVMQFTPMSWTGMRWLDPNSSIMRILAICLLMIMWQIVELNTFFLKDIFKIPSEHPLVFIRIIIIGLLSAPSIRQYYTYVTDPRCNRLGTQCWIYICCIGEEVLITLKFGKLLFKETRFMLLLLWLLLMLIICIVSLYLNMIYYKWVKKFRNRKSTVTTIPSQDDSDTDFQQCSQIEKSYTIKRIRGEH